MKKAIKDILLKLMFSIFKKYTSFITICHLVANLYDKTKYVIHIGNLKQTLNPWLLLIKSSYSNLIESKCIVKTIYWYKQYWSQKKSKKWFGKRLLC